jgi:hypothetical protein
MKSTVKDLIEYLQHLEPGEEWELIAYTDEWGAPQAGIEFKSRPCWFSIIESDKELPHKAYNWEASTC